MSQKPKFNSIQQTIYDEGDPESFRVTSYGKTAGGVKTPLLVANDGTVQTSASVTFPTTPLTVVNPSASSLNATVIISGTPTVNVTSAQVVQPNASSLNATVIISGTPTVNVSSLPAIPTHAVTQSGTWNTGANGGSLSAFQGGSWNFSANGGSLTSFVSSLPNRSLTLDEMSVAQDVGRLVASLTAVSPQYATINVSTAGDNTIVAAVSNKKITVLQYSLVVGANGDGVTWKQGSTAVSGQMRFSANGGISTAYSPVGLFQTASGSTLYLNSSLGSQISGHLVYVSV